MRQFTTGDLNKVGDVIDAAAREPIVLTRHRKPCFVLRAVSIASGCVPEAILAAPIAFPICRRNIRNSSPRRLIGWRAARGMTMSRKFLPGRVITYPGCGNGVRPVAQKAA